MTYLCVALGTSLLSDWDKIEKEIYYFPVCAHNRNVRSYFHPAPWNGRKWYCCKNSTKLTDGCRECNSWIPSPESSPSKDSIKENLSNNSKYWVYLMNYLYSLQFWIYWTIVVLYLHCLQRQNVIPRSKRPQSTLNKRTHCCPNTREMGTTRTNIYPYA